MHASILPRDDDTQHMTFEGKRVVLLTRESGTYREWDVTVAGVQHSIIDEDGTWTLMVYVPTCLEWVDVPGMNVDTFLSIHKLILAA